MFLTNHWFPHAKWQRYQDPPMIHLFVYRLFCSWRKLLLCRENAPGVSFLPHCQLSIKAKKSCFQSSWGSQEKIGRTSWKIAMRNLRYELETDGKSRSNCRFLYRMTKRGQRWETDDQLSNFEAPQLLPKHTYNTIHIYIYIYLLCYYNILYISNTCVYILYIYTSKVLYIY